MICRVQEYTSQASDILASLRSTQLCIPLLADFLNNAKSQGLYNQQSIRDVLIDCNKQLEALEKEAKRIIPLPANTKPQHWSKAMISMRTGSRIHKGEQDIEKNQETLKLWILGPNTTTMGIAKVGMPKRDVFFTYEWIMQVDDFYTHCDTWLPTKEDW